MKVKKLLSYFPLDDGQIAELKSLLENAYILQRNAESITAEDVADADVIFGNVSPELLKGALNLKWIHLSSAGTDGYLPLIDRGVLISNGSGAYNDLIAEHMLAFTGALCVGLPGYGLQHQQRIWKRGPWAKTITGSTVAVLGCGNIGTAYAQRMHMLGAYVIGVRRKAAECPDGVDEMVGMDRADEVISRADIIAMIMPNTPETVNFMDERRFGLVKKGAILINCGRGNAVDPDALYNSLANGNLSAAAIDVAYKEPLPDNDKLWTLPNLIITPHVAGGWNIGGDSSPYMSKKVVDVFVKNLKAYMAGDSLPNAVDPSTGYMAHK